MVKALKQQICNLLVVVCCVVQTQKHIMEIPDSLDLSTLMTQMRDENITLQLLQNIDRYADI